MFTRELCAAGLSVVTPERLTLEIPEREPALEYRRRKPARRKAAEVGSRAGGIIREACGGGYRVRRVSSSY